MTSWNELSHTPATVLPLFARKLSNVGEIPITVKPGTAICQLFIHELTKGDPKLVDRSRFIGRRKPALRPIELDETARRLGKWLP